MDFQLSKFSIPDRTYVILQKPQPSTPPSTLPQISALSRGQPGSAARSPDLHTGKRGTCNLSNMKDESCVNLGRMERTFHVSQLLQLAVGRALMLSCASIAVRRRHFSNQGPGLVVNVKDLIQCRIMIIEIAHHKFGRVKFGY